MLIAVKTLLSSIVDYAGLFPPASLNMRQAMQNYSQYRLSANAWMLNRFVLLFSQLEEFAALLPEFSFQHWPLSLILPTDLEPVFTQIQSLNIPEIAIASLELPPLPLSEIEALFPYLPSGIEIFFEIPLHENLEPYLAVLSQLGASAKVRTGGNTVDSFPNTEQLAEFILSCAGARIPFKATAGLHHPLPACHPITYEPDSPTALMHGFLNVALLATLAFGQKITLQEALQLLQENSSSHFHFTGDRVSWGIYHLSSRTIETVRQKFFRSFGSCSFQEPVDDLKQLNLL